MGDRIALRFKQGKDFSPYLYAHWDGLKLISKVYDFYEDYIATGIIRKEPANVMFNFCCYLRGEDIEDGGYYLYEEKDCCSPDDNGFWVYDLDNGRPLRE